MRVEKWRRELGDLVKKVEMLDPRWQPSMDLRGVLSSKEIVSYAKIANVTSTVKSDFKESEQDKSNVQTWLSVDTQTRGRSRSRNRSSNISDESKLQVGNQSRLRSKSPMFSNQDFTKLNVKNIRSRSKSPMRLPNKQINEAQRTLGLSVTPVRSRSKSPMYVPGTSASFSDIVRGCSRNNSRAPSTEDIKHVGVTVVKPKTIETSVSSTVVSEIPVIQTTFTEYSEAPIIKTDITEVKSSQINTVPKLIEPQLTEYSLSDKQNITTYKQTSIFSKVEIKRTSEVKTVLKNIKTEISKEVNSDLSVQQARSRSKSPIYIPGKSIPYSQMLQQGKQFVEKSDEKSLTDISDSSLEREVVVRGRSPTRRKPPRSKNVEQSEENLPSSIKVETDSVPFKSPVQQDLNKTNNLINKPLDKYEDSSTTKFIKSEVDQFRKDLTKTTSLISPDVQRCRSKSPIYIPGESVTYSDILKGASSRHNSPSLMSGDASGPLQSQTLMKKTESTLLPTIRHKVQIQVSSQERRDEVEQEESTSSQPTPVDVQKEINKTIKGKKKPNGDSTTNVLNKEPQTTKIKKNNLKESEISKEFSNLKTNQLHQVEQPSEKPKIEGNISTEKTILENTESTPVTSVEYTCAETGVCLAHSFPVSHVEMVSGNVFSGFMETPVSFIASGQQLMDSGLGTYHPDDVYRPIAMIKPSTDDQTEIKVQSDKSSEAKTEHAKEFVKDDFREKAESKSKKSKKGKNKKLEPAKVGSSSDKTGSSTSVMEVASLQTELENKDAIVTCGDDGQLSPNKVDDNGDLTEDIIMKKKFPSEELIKEDEFTEIKSKRNSKKKRDKFDNVSTEKMKDSCPFGTDEIDFSSTQEEEISSVKVKKSVSKKKSINTEKVSDVNLTSSSLLLEPNVTDDGKSSTIKPKRSSKKKKDKSSSVVPSSKTDTFSEEVIIQTVNEPIDWQAEEEENLILNKPKRKSSKKKKLNKPEMVTATVSISEHLIDEKMDIKSENNDFLEIENVSVENVKDVIRSVPADDVPILDFKDEEQQSGAPPTADEASEPIITGSNEEERPVKIKRFRNSKKKRESSSELSTPSSSSVSVAVNEASLPKTSDEKSLIVEEEIITTIKPKRSSKKKKDKISIVEVTETSISEVTAYNETSETLVKTDDGSKPIKPKRSSKKKSITKEEKGDPSSSEKITQVAALSDEEKPEISPIELNISHDSKTDFVESTSSSSTIIADEIPNISKPIKAKRSSKKKKGVKEEKSIAITGELSTYKVLSPIENIDDESSEIILPSESQSDMSEPIFESIVFDNKLIMESESSLDQVKFDESSDKQPVENQSQIEQKRSSKKNKNIKQNKNELSESNLTSSGIVAIEETDVIIEENISQIKSKRSSKNKKGSGHQKPNDSSDVSTEKLESPDASTEDQIKPKRNSKKKKVVETKIDNVSTIDTETLIDTNLAFNKEKINEEITVASDLEQVIVTAPTEELSGNVDTGSLVEGLQPKRRSKKKKGKISELDSTLVEKDVSISLPESFADTSVTHLIVLPEQESPVCSQTPFDFHTCYKNNSENVVSSSENLELKSNEIIEGSDANIEVFTEIKVEEELTPQIDEVVTSLTLSKIDEAVDPSNLLAIPVPPSRRKSKKKKSKREPYSEGLDINLDVPTSSFEVDENLKEKEITEVISETSLLLDDSINVENIIPKEIEIADVESSMTSTPIVELEHDENISTESENFNKSAKKKKKKTKGDKKTEMVVESDENALQSSSATSNLDGAPANQNEAVKKKSRVLADFSNTTNISPQTDLENISEDNTRISDMTRTIQSFDFSKYADKENRESFKDEQESTPSVGYPIKKDKRIVEFGPFKSLLAENRVIESQVKRAEFLDMERTAIEMCEGQTNVILDKSEVIEPLECTLLPTFSKSDDEKSSLLIISQSSEIISHQEVKNQGLALDENVSNVQVTDDLDDDDFDMPALLSDEDFTFVSTAKVNEDSKNLIESESSLTLSGLPGREDVITEERTLPDSSPIDDNNKILDDILNKSLDALLDDDYSTNVVKSKGESSPGTISSVPKDEALSLISTSIQSSSVECPALSTNLIESTQSVEATNYSTYIQKIYTDFSSHASSLPGSYEDAFEQKLESVPDDISTVFAPGSQKVIGNNMKGEGVTPVKTEVSDEISPDNSLKDLCKNISLELNTFNLKKVQFAKNESLWLKSYAFVEEKILNDETTEPLRDSQETFLSMPQQDDIINTFTDWTKPLSESSAITNESQIWTLTGQKSPTIAQDSKLSQITPTSLGFEDSFDPMFAQSLIKDSKENPPQYPHFATTDLSASDIQKTEVENKDLPRDETKQSDNPLISVVSDITSLISKTSALVSSATPLIFPHPVIETSSNEKKSSEETSTSTDPKDKQTVPIDPLWLEKQKYTQSETDAISALIELNSIKIPDEAVPPTSLNIDRHSIHPDNEGTAIAEEEEITAVSVSHKTEVQSDLPSRTSDSSSVDVEKFGKPVEEPICVSVKTTTHIDTVEEPSIGKQVKPIPKPRIAKTPDVRIESFETTETEDTSDSTHPTRGSFDTLSSRDMSQDQSVDDILVEIKGTIEDTHPSNVQVSAHINISTSEGKVSHGVTENRITRTQRIIQTRKRIIRKTVIVDGVETTVEEVVEEPEVINESVQEEGFSGAESFRQESSEESRSLSSEIIKGFSHTVINGKEVVEEFSGGSETPVITEVLDEPSESPLRKGKPVPTTSVESDDAINEEGSSSSRTVYSSAEIDIPTSGEVIIHPEFPESFTQHYSNISNREFVTTVHSSMRTSVKRVRRVIRKVIIKDGKQEIVEEVVDEPEEVEVEESAPHISTFEHMEGMKNLVQSVNIPENQDVEYEVKEGGNVQTSVHSVTRTINKVIRRVQIIDGKEVITEELIQDPSESHIAEVDSPSVTVSHRVDRVEEGKLSDSPDVVVNVGSWSKSSTESKKFVQRQSKEEVSEMRDSHSTQNSSSMTRVIRKVVIVGDHEMRESSSLPVEITEVCSEINDDEIKDPEEISVVEGSTSTEHISKIKDIKAKTKSGDKVQSAESSDRHPEQSNIHVEVASTSVITPESDFIKMEQEHSTRLLVDEHSPVLKSTKIKKSESKKEPKAKPKEEVKPKTVEKQEKSPPKEKPKKEKGKRGKESPQKTSPIKDIKSEEIVDKEQERATTKEESVSIKVEDSIKISKDKKKKAKPLESKKSVDGDQVKIDERQMKPGESEGDKIASVKSQDFISMEQGHTSGLLGDPNISSKPTSSDREQTILKTVITSVEPGDEDSKKEPKGVKTTKTKEKKSKDRRRRSTLKSDESIQEALQVIAKDSITKTEADLPTDEVVISDKIEVLTKSTDKVVSSTSIDSSDITESIVESPKSELVRESPSRTVVKSKIVEKVTSEPAKDEKTKVEVSLSSTTVVEVSGSKSDKNLIDDKKSEVSSDSLVSAVSNETKVVPTPEMATPKDIPPMTDQVDLKTGKIRKSKKKRPSVKDVFSSVEKDDEPGTSIPPSIEVSGRSDLPKGEIKISPDRDARSKRSEKKQVPEAEVPVSPAYSVEVKTATQDETPKVELSVRVNEKGIPVVEVFTKGGVEENLSEVGIIEEPTTQVSAPTSIPIEEQIVKETIEVKVPLQVPKSDQVEPKKKSKKKREKGVPCLTESSSIEDTIEPITKSEVEKVPKVVAVMKQTKREIEDVPAEVSKSPDSTSEDDISKRTIRKAKRKLPQLKAEEQVTPIPLMSSTTVESTMISISAESSVPVMASFPNEPDNLREGTSRMLEMERTIMDVNVPLKEVEQNVNKPSNEIVPVAGDESGAQDNLLAEKKKKKKGKDSKGKPKRLSDPHVKISATVTSSAVESSSNIEYVLSRDEPNSVNLAIQHSDDSVKVSVSTSGNDLEVKDQPSDTVARVNVSIERSLSPHSRTNINEFIESERGHSTNLLEKERTLPIKSKIDKKTDNRKPISDSEKLNEVPTSIIIESAPTVEDVSSKVLTLKAPPQMYQVILGDISDTYDINIINNNLNKMKEAKSDEEVQITIISTIVTITEYLEIITYKIYSTKRTTLMTDEEKLVKLDKLKKDLTNLEDAAKQCLKASKSEELGQTVEALKKGVSDTLETADNAHSQLRLVIATSDEFLNGVNNVTVLLNGLAEDIDKLSRDQTTPTMTKLEKLYEYEEENEEYIKEVVRLRRVGGEVQGALDVGIINRSQAANLRDRLEQDLSLALEYRDTLAELEQVTAMANNIVNTRPVVNSLEHLQAELQKDRKFFANLTRCRALLESLECHLDEDTRSSHSSLHRDLHRRATQILERASSRAEAMAQTASKWTLLEGRLKEERAWLGVAAQRVPGLAGVTSADYEQYISLYQNLSYDISQHSGCIWRWLCIAHSLQDLVTCRPLEDSCEHLREVISDLETRVSSDLARLTAFRQVWTRYESLQDRVEHWLNQVERNDRLHQPTTNIVNFWELKAEYEVYKELRNEAGLEFETAVRTLPISDEQSERVNRSRSSERWAKLEAVLASLQESVETQGGSVSERLDIADRQLAAVRELLDRLEYVTPADAQQLSLHTEQLQVVKQSVERISSELGRLGPVPCELADRVGQAQGTTRSLEARAFKQLTTHRDTEARLGKLTKAMARLHLHHAKAATTLEQAAKLKDVDYDHLMQALEKTKNVVSRLEEDRRLLDRVQDWVAEVSDRCPGLAATLTSDVSRISSSQLSLETLAGNTLAQLSQQAQLWDHYITKRDGLKSSLRQANYMMDLLTIRGRVDYQHLVKTTNRLNGVAETLGKVEGGEVWTAAEELKARLNGPEAQALEAEVQGLQAELASTSRQLEAMCSKYRKAAELWASARTLQDQIASSLEQTVAALHNPLPSLAQALPTVTDEEKVKLKELEELAEGIADQIGVERELLLGKQVDSLTQRLRDVESTLDELAQIQRLADQPTTNGDTLPADKAATKELLDNGDEGTVDRLVELRDHLITLGRNQPNYESSNTAATIPSDHTLRHKLQLWEELFRSTFQEYHRVSSKLASTGEANTLVKLWRDYLEQVNAFLTTPLPDEYQSLTYHTSLCQAHQNVLGSQHAILEKKRVSPDKVDKELIEEFNTLTNLHNETLAKIIERQQQVASRVGCWERYRDEKNKLLTWLRDMETSRNKLNLRYLKIKTVPVILLNIQDLLDKIPEGESQEKVLRDHLKKILDFTEDESLAKSLRLDQATIAQRITNMAAALQTWKGYMVRVNEYIDSFESQTNKLTSTLTEIRSKIPESEQPDMTQKEIKEKLQLLKDLMIRISSANDSLTSINETEDRLKEYISPVDAKGVCQRVWILRQQTIELERNIEMHIQMLEERLQLAHIYEKREKKFLDWVKSVEERLEGGVSSTSSERPGGLSGEAEDELTRLEAEVEAEMGMRKAEVEWLVTTGESLRRMSPEPDEQSSPVEDAWARLQQATQLRSNKLRALIQSTSKLEIRFEELRLWLETMEAKLAQPFVIQSSKKDEITRLMSQQESIQNEIQKQSSNVADILNTCEIILNDCDTCHVSLETQGITSAMENIEKRWKGVCVKSAELKLNLKNLWGLIQQLISLHKKQETWLKQQKSRFQKLEHKVATTGHLDLPTLASNLQKLESDVNSGSQGLSLVEELYSRVASSACVDSSVTKPLSDLLNMWYQLKRDIGNTSSDVQATIDKLNRFNEAQSECVVGLSAVDALLAIAEAGRASSPSERVGTLAVGTELERARAETNRLLSAVSRADTAANLLMECSNQEDRTRIDVLVAEYKQLWDSVQDRIDRLTKQMVNRGCLVDTLKFETDASIQVNTLEGSVTQSRASYSSNEPSPGSVTRQQAYSAELDSTMAELSRLLDQLETTKHSSSLQLNKLLGGCQSTLELVRHLSQSLMSECGLTEEESRVSQVNSLEERFNTLQAKSRDRDQLTVSSVSGRLTCPLCSSKNWKQFDNDIWRLEQWLQYAEGFFTSQPTVLPASIEHLEDIIQDHREVMLNLDSHHRLVLSLNIIGNHLAEHSEDEARANELKVRLTASNTRWEEVCSTAAHWHTKLHQALMQNDEFHENMSSLVEWLERTEITIKESEPVDLTDPTPVIQAKYNKFRELRGELERCEPRVRSLEEAASEVLRGQENRTTVERLAAIRLRLQSLSRLVSVYVLKLGAVLGDDPANLLPLSQPSLDTLSQQLLDNAAGAPTTEESNDGVDTGPLVRSCRFFGRVVRASLPISALLLLVLGATTLVPVTQEDYSCTLANTLLTSFTPVLRYPYGRPPV